MMDKKTVISLLIMVTIVALGIGFGISKIYEDTWGAEEIVEEVKYDGFVYIANFSLKINGKTIHTRDKADAKILDEVDEWIKVKYEDCISIYTTGWNKGYDEHNETVTKWILKKDFYPYLSENETLEKIYKAEDRLAVIEKKLKIKPKL